MFVTNDFSHNPKQAVRWAASLQWCDGRAGLMPPNRFNNTSYKPVVENRLATTESRWVILQWQLLSVAVSTPLQQSHIPALWKKIVFLTRDVFFLPFKIKAYTVPVTVLFVTQLPEMHKHTWHHVCVWITASRMPYLLVQTELLWFQMWEPALGDYSPGLGC